MANWNKLAQLTGDKAKEVSEAAGELARLIRTRLGEVRLSAWDRLPMVARLKAGGESQKARRYFPSRVLDLAPPSPSFAVVGKNGSHLLLDTIHKRLVVVLYDWDMLSLPIGVLEQAGLPGNELVVLLDEERSSRARPDGPAKWKLVHRGEAVEVHTGLLDGSVSPVVGRLLLGKAPVDDSDYDVEVVALPRLSASTIRSGDTIDLREEDSRTDVPCYTSFLYSTVWRTGTPTALIGLLRLAHGEGLVLGEEPVRLASDDDPSPLVWLALAEALERAAEHQRRQYVRQAEVRKAPVGTIQMSAWVNNLARQRPDLVPVVRFSLSGDCDENRLFRGMARNMTRILRGRDGLSRWMARRFEAIECAFEKAEPVEPQLWTCESLLLQELPVPIKRAVEQCRAALAGQYPGLHLHDGDLLKTQSFELDLASLFEAAMRRLVQDLLSGQGLEVIDGNLESVEHDIRWVEDGGGNNRLKPDLVVRLRSGGPSGDVVAIGDAKYKRPAGKSDYRPLWRADFQQLVTYMLAWPTAQWGMVLTPWESPPEGGCGSSKLQELQLPDGRVVGVFQIAAEKWKHWALEREPLWHWMRQRLK